jgi:hypothetical protein
MSAAKNVVVHQRKNRPGNCSTPRKQICLRANTERCYFSDNKEECLGSAGRSMKCLKVRNVPKDLGKETHKIILVLLTTVTAGRCAEKGMKIIDNDGGIWDILKQLS